MRIHIISELKGRGFYDTRKNWDGDVGVSIIGSGYVGLPLANAFVIENK